jgi:hypothetical protein
MTRSGWRNGRRQRRWLTVAAWVAASWVKAGNAGAADRVAVVVLAENPTDAALAENLGEVAIARLAENGSGELVGVRELDRLLQRDHDRKDLATCMSEPACFVHLREELGIALVVAGKLRREGVFITLDLALLDAATGTQRHRVLRTSKEEVTELVRATRASVAELLAFSTAPGVPPPARAPILTLPVPRLAAARSVSIPARPSPQQPPPMSLRAAVGYGSGALSVLVLSAAAVVGTWAEQEPSGATRRETQMDLERGRSLASTANVLWISGGVLAVVSVIAFVLPSQTAAPR